MKTERIFNVITIAAVGAIDLYFFGFFVLCLLGFDTIGMAIFALFVMSAVTLPVIFREKLSSRLGRAFRPLKAIFACLLAVYVITVAIFWCYIGFDGAKRASTYADAIEVSSSPDRLGANTLIVVFGCRTEGYTPSDSLRLRLDEAYELLTLLPDSLCVVSGGQGSNETIPEAVAMKHYLVERGIDSSRIFEEQNSHTTSENIRFTKELVDSLGIHRERIIGVSTAFHLPRIEKLAERYWQKIEVCAAPSAGNARYYVSMVREYLSYIKMLLFDKAVINF